MPAAGTAQEAETEEVPAPPAEVVADMPAEVEAAREVIGEEAVWEEVPAPRAEAVVDVPRPLDQRSSARRRRSWRWWTPCAWCRRRSRQRIETPRAEPGPVPHPPATVDIGSGPAAADALILARLPEARRRTDPATVPISLPEFGGISDESWVQCAECHNWQPVVLVFCSWCGAVTLPAALGPEPRPVTRSPDEEEPPALTHGKRVSGTEFLVWCVVLLLFLAWFAFLSPWRVLVHEATARAIGAGRTLIDPDAGQLATVRRVTATATLKGTNPESLASVGARSFWATPPSPKAGVGSELYVYFDDTVVIDRLVIEPGIQNGQFSPRALATPRKITLIVPSRELPLDDTTPLEVPLELQQIETNRNLTQTLDFSALQTDRIRLRIDDLYPPEYGTPNSVAIASIAFVRQTYGLTGSTPTTAEMPKVVLPPNVWVPPRIPLPNQGASLS